MFQFKQLCCAILMLLYHNVSAQVVLTVQEAVSYTLKNSPMLKASDLQVKNHRQLKGAAINIANPDILIESPTGEFMTIGVVQSFDFPTVYFKQGQLAKQQVLLAEKNKLLSEFEITYRVKSTYLNLQFSIATFELVKKQDSIYAQIASLADRQFQAGQIDFVARTFAISQYGEIHNNLIRAEADFNAALYELKIYTGLTDSLIVAELTASNMVLSYQFDSTDVVLSPLMQYQYQAVAVAKKELQLKRNKALPGFSIGYLNPGGSDVEFPMRLRAGINIPLWFWQYSSSVKAAKTNVEIVNQNLLNQQQEILLRLNKQTSDAVKYKTILNYYTEKGLKETQELNSSSMRMFDAGQIDYISYLRTLSESYEIMTRHLESIRNYNQSLVNINYLITLQ